MRAYLILEDGHIFTGTGIGAEKEVVSEVVFNTSMTGYLEILTDPSYAGQAVVMTYPLIGNYGICTADMESLKPWPDAFIVRETARVPSNFRSQGSLDEFLKKHDIPGIAGIDTRALTKILRESGTMNGLITTKEYSLKNSKATAPYSKIYSVLPSQEEVEERLKAYKVTGVVSKVTCKEKSVTTHEAFVPTNFEEAKMSYMATPEMKTAIKAAKAAGVCLGEIAMCSMQGTTGIAKLKEIASNPSKAAKHYKVALMDFGSKKNIEHCLLKRGCEVTIYPAFTKAEEILTGGYDGIMLSNGPGDPAECIEIIAEIKKLYDSDIPIFAICLGHQLMALANGFQTEKMKYGHRGANHPVKDLASGRVYLSSQNHGYVVVADSIDPTKAEIGFINANDKTVEGLRYKGKKVFTVQFHPEACAGPQDSEFLFDEFIKMMEG